MKNLFKNAWIILKLHSLLTVPFILYLYFMSLVMTKSQNAPTSVAFCVFVIAAFLLTSCFFSGWFFMAKNAINNFKEIETKGPNPEIDYAFSNLKMFYSGVGEYFIPTILAIVFYLGLLALFMFVIYALGYHVIGEFPISYSQLKLISISPIETNHVVNALNQNEVVKLSAWSFLFVSAYLLFSFSTMFYFPALFLSSKNCIVAFIKGFMLTYRNIAVTITLFLFYVLSKTILSILNTLFASNFLLSTACLLIIVYFAAYWIIIVYCAYEQKENYSNYGTDSFREE